MQWRSSGNAEGRMIGASKAGSVVRRLDGGDGEISEKEGRADELKNGGRRKADYTAPEQGRWDGQ
jgi:hypothetical protein